MVDKLILLVALILVSTGLTAWAQDAAPATPAAAASASPTDSNGVQEKELEVAVGIDEIVKLDFDFSTKISIGNEDNLALIVAPQKKQITFRGRKPGRTSVTIFDNVGELRLRYIVNVTANGKSNTVAELRELLGDVEGLEIGIKGGKVFVGGEIVVPGDIGKVATVLGGYQEVLRLVELSPQTQRVIARKIMDELAKNGLKDVTVRVVNKVFWLEGVVSSAGKKELAQSLAFAYLPDGLDSLATGQERVQSVKRDPILNFISVNEKKDPQPPPKLVKVVSQFVELSKDYSKVFAFKWAPLMGADESQISVGPNPSGSGGLTTQSSGTLSATISNLFPKLNSAKSAGYARVIQSGMVVTKDQQAATIKKSRDIPFAVGGGDFTKSGAATITFTMNVTPKILEQEKVELAVGLEVALPSGNAPGGQPTTTNNSVSTNLVVKSKESAAIGGIVQSTSTTAYDKDDPAPIDNAQYLFRLIRSKNYQTSKGQFVMFITPEIIESAAAGTEEIRKKFRRRNN